MTEQSLALLESLALAGMEHKRVRESCEIVREIAVSDIPAILQELREHNWSKAAGPGSHDLRVLRSGHHHLAQLLAAGVKPVDASLITGRSLSAISALQEDMAFKELLDHYRSVEEVKSVDLYDRATRIGLLASEILQERLEESPEKFSNNELKQLLEVGTPKEGRGERRDSGPALNVAINFLPPASRVPGVDDKTIEAEIIDDKK